jgi:hypothetical protein
MEVRIYVPPQALRKLVEKAIPKPPEPEPPVRTDANVVGKEISMVIWDDPAYLKAHERWEEVEIPEWNARVAEETDRRGSLFMFKDLQVPEDWDIEAEVGEIIRMDDPDWEPTPGELGRKRDYIQWELLVDPEDALLVQTTLLELAGMSPEGVDAFLASFRNQVEGQAA